MDQQASSSSSPLLDLYATQNEDLDDKNDTPEHTSPVATDRRSKSPELSAEAREAQAIEQLNSVSTLFPGPNPFLQYAKALARSKGRLTNEGSGMTTDELIEKSRNDGVELSNRLSGILEKTNNLFWSVHPSIPSCSVITDSDPCSVVESVLVKLEFAQSLKRTLTSSLRRINRLKRRRRGSGIGVDSF